MQLKFDANLQFQLDAVNAVVDVFDGQPINQSDFEISFTTNFSLVDSTELGVGNKLVLDDEQALRNLHDVQDKNDIENTSIENEGKNFSVEMETGTGKTYVYIRTIFELNKKYGFKKFIIVVPSVAIKEGTLKNFDITKAHFANLFNNVPFEYCVYDSKKVSQLRQFATSNQMQILIMNIDAFRKTLEGMDDEKKSNVIHRESDRLSGRKPIEFIQATNPIVVIDEPQSVDNTERAKEAIKTLNPLFILRYSATHRSPYNLLYRLDPIKAYEMKLVKRIEVDSVTGDESYNDAFVKLESVDNTKGLSAKLTIHFNSSSGVISKSIKVKYGDDLFVKSNERETYKNGFIVNEISAEPENEFITFDSGRRVSLGQTHGGMTDEIMKVQIKRTIQEHLEKEMRVKAKGIKVLSLFFIDKVANYRFYDEQGNPVKGKFALWFEQLYRELTSNSYYKDVIPYPVEKLHEGYFAIDNKGKMKDTRGDSAADEDVYNLIMKEKEQLLSPEEPLRFIFSHSALREGWDNPNVFQICTLNVTKSEMKKRQEIGRGLRLPVNKDGDRIFDDNINRLTVIANESYEDFARKLQMEIEDDFDVKFGRIEKIAFSKLPYVVHGEEVKVGQDKSSKIWEDLQKNGYIDNDGKIQPKFNPTAKDFDLQVSPDFADIKEAIIEVVQSYQFSGHIVNKNTRRAIKLNKGIYLDEEFKKLWEKINKRTTFSVEFDTNELTENASKAIGRMEAIDPLKIRAIKVGVDIQKAGIITKEVKSQVTSVDASSELPDILAYLQKETYLTRATLAKLLIHSGKLNEFVKNPQRFMDAVAKLINKELHALMIDGIKYEKVDGEIYEMRRFEEEELVKYLTNLLDVKKSVYDAIEYDSDTERRFAEVLDNREDIRLFVKLPSKFQIDTPLGTYNPDWAIVKQNDQTLYLVRETKSTKDFEKLRNIEAYKIRCAQKHFEEIEVNFKTVIYASEV